MNANDRKRLEYFANLMLKEAQAAGNDRIFSASGFARENISIVHQQRRCANLAWALSHTKKIKRGDVVAIVGGSFSGIMLASALAIANDVVVYVFEKEKRLLHKYLDKSHRFISPNLNSRRLGKNFDPSFSAPFFDTPVFQWHRGTSSDVASEWLREFERYQKKLPIFTFFNRGIAKRNIKRREGGLTLDLRNQYEPNIKPIDVDLLIDATGFGEEANPHGIVDFSYWQSGHRLIYENLPPHCNVLVSGCGDSGVIEALHYTIADFHHELVESFWPVNSKLEAHLDISLETARLDNILNSPEIERYSGKVISEICWWLDSWFRIQYWKNHNWSLRVDGWHAVPIFRAIDEALFPRLKEAFPTRNLKSLHWEEREAFVLKLPLKSQIEIRNRVRPIADAWISHRIARAARSIPLGKLLRIRTLHKTIRPNVTITLNGTTPTPYTRQLSNYNVWLMRILTSFPNVNYRQGQISSIGSSEGGQFHVKFIDGTMGLFDRVATRYGPSPIQKKRHQLANRRSSDPHHGEWLLTPVGYFVPTDQANVQRSVDAPTQRIVSKLDEVESRRGFDRTSPLDKNYYVYRLINGPNVFSEKDEIYRDPQAWLTSKLRSGVRPSYVENGYLANHERERRSK